MLLERLPGGRVVALDGSPSMLDQARRRLERFGDRVEFVHADLRGPLSPAIPEPVDAVLSTATFHWIHDHAALYRHLAEVVRPDGRLVAQYGGAGNTASVRAVLATIGDGWTGDVFFAEPDETRGWLADAGWEDIEAWLQPEPTRFEPGEPFKAFLRTVILGAHLARLPEGGPGCVRRRGCGAPARRRDRLRATERHRTTRRLTPFLSDRRGTARRGRGSRTSATSRTRVRVGRRAAPGPGVGVDLGRPVGPPPEVGHRIGPVLGVDDERGVLLGVAGRQPELRVGRHLPAVAAVVEPEVVLVASPEVDDLGVRETARR